MLSDGLSKIAFVMHPDTLLKHTDETGIGINDYIQ